jgi:hypothetical protein
MPIHNGMKARRRQDDQDDVDQLAGLALLGGLYLAMLTPCRAGFIKKLDVEAVHEVAVLAVMAQHRQDRGGVEQQDDGPCDQQRMRAPLVGARFQVAIATKITASQRPITNAHATSTSRLCIASIL